MKLQSGRIAILATDQVSNGLLIHFSDGMSVLYQTQFLYEVQNDDGNTQSWTNLKTTRLTRRA